VAKRMSYSPNLGMGNILYIVILRAHDNCIVVLQLLSYRLYIISGVFT